MKSPAHDDMSTYSRYQAMNATVVGITKPRNLLPQQREVLALVDPDVGLVLVGRR